MAPIVRNGADGERELVMARWGMRGPPQFGGAPITNIGDLGSPHWRGWLGKQNRCIVRATSFCEYAEQSRARRGSGSRRDGPLFAFAGLWTRGAALEGRRARQSMGSMSYSAFSRQKRMPSWAQFIRRRCCYSDTPGEVDLWLLADSPKALELQRPLPDDALRIVASGEKEDGARQAAPTRESRANAPTLTRCEGFSLPKRYWQPQANASSRGKPFPAHPPDGNQSPTVWASFMASGSLNMKPLSQCCVSFPWPPQSSGESKPGRLLGDGRAAAVALRGGLRHIGGRSR